jgi:lipoate-protein ligase A
MHLRATLAKNKLSYFTIVQKSLRDPYFQLAWEEALALSMAEFQIKLGVRIWSNHNTIVLGISENELSTIHNQTVDNFFNFKQRLDGGNFDTFSPPEVWIARRASGGGTVYQGIPGNLNYSIFIDISNHQELYPIQHSYNVLLDVICSALMRQGCTAISAGKSDIGIKSPDGSLKKISGNAQFRKKNILVQHGTLILSSDLFDQVEKFQLHPPEEPEYRAKRSHREFLTHIGSDINEKALASDILSILKEYLANTSSSDHLTSEDTERINNPSSLFSFYKASIKKAKELRSSKYSSNNWIFRGKK